MTKQCGTKYEKTRSPSQNPRHKISVASFAYCLKFDRTTTNLPKRFNTRLPSDCRSLVDETPAHPPQKDCLNFMPVLTCGVCGCCVRLAPDHATTRTEHAHSIRWRFCRRAKFRGPTNTHHALSFQIHSFHLRNFFTGKIMGFLVCC